MSEDPLFDDDRTTVRIVDPDREDFHYEPPPPSRTPQQRTQDEILDQAERGVIVAQGATTETLEWMDLLTDLPKELRHNLPALLNDLGTLINEERRLRQ